ncbi:MAG: hypothetical protein IJS14_06800 [Lentisphaeria bacterium]|nr:hypothetical protein [Lentisphaeria bacterium]
MGEADMVVSVGRNINQDIDVVKIPHQKPHSVLQRLVRLRQGCGGTTFDGFAAFRQGYPPLVADGLPGSKKSRQFADGL